MGCIKRISLFIIFFTIITVFIGAVSANNWTVNPGDSIQATINNASVNDTITVNDNDSNYTYTENLIINKTLTLKTTGNVTIITPNSSISTIIINSGGNGSTIQGFIIKGATGTGKSGICLDGASNCIIRTNTITDNYIGINIFSNNNTIELNNITNNSWMGINLSYLTNNLVQNNSIYNNTWYGIHLGESNNITIISNSISYSVYGINPQISNANIYFNRIVQCSKFGLVNQDSTVNATNNWWGTNDPYYVNSPNWPATADIYVESGSVISNPHLNLIISTSYENIPRNVSRNVTADLTRNNNGIDTSLSGNIIDNIPINFSTTLGTITTPAFTKNGKTVTNFNSGTISGLVTIYAILDKQTVSKTLNIIGIYNNRTLMGYVSLQTAINDALDGDTIWLENGIYTENIIVNKSLTIKARENHNVTIQALNPTNHVITVRSHGTKIEGLTVKGANNAIGILLDSNASIRSSNCTVKNNYVTNNYYGIYSLGNNNTITNNTVINNNWMAIILIDATNNLIKNNTLLNNNYGIYLRNSNNITIKNNNIAGGGMYGINPQSSTANINFNKITGCTVFGIVNQVNSVINATNNWWGTNNPTISTNAGNDICNFSGTIAYNPWLILNITSSTNNLSHNTTCDITADLTHDNKGNDTSSQDHIPDGIPINFDTNLGTITNPTYTLNGKANSTLNMSLITSGTATIIATLDNQSVQTSVTLIIDTINPVVTANLASGIYNTAKSVTLTASDNLDLNPVVYYSLNNGSTWSSEVKTVTLNLNQGITNLKFYARDAANNTCPNQTITYTLDTTTPTVTANLASGTYNTTQSVTLTATDNLDPNPVIYYTTDSSNPTNQSTIYTSPINITQNTILKFIVQDNAGNQAAIQTRYYSFNLLIVNTNTERYFSSIQDAIDDTLTLNGQTIEIMSGIYTENVIVNKSVTIRAVPGNKVTVNALNTSNPIFTITPSGSGSCIEGLTLIGPTTSYTIRGIFLQHANNCSIISNIINGNYYGIISYSSNYTLLLNNTINNSTYAINLDTSSGNLIMGNLISENYEGIWAHNCMNNTIYKNNMSYNRYNGINFNGINNLIFQNCISHNNGSGIIFSSSYNNSILENDISYNLENGLSFYSFSGDVNFNRIIGNTLHGLITNENCTINATNNWWGSNTPTNSSTNGSDIYSTGGNITCETWLVLNLTGSVIHVTHDNTSDSQVTADLTHNNHDEDTSSSGTVPDGIPVNFTTTLGTITSTTTTRRGKASVSLTSNSSSGSTTVTTILDNQTISKSFRKSFNTIQSAISNSLTANGDVILVENGTYTENIVVSKNLTIVSDGNVTVQASNTSNPVLTITSSGSGSLIQGFVISGAVNSFGLLLNGCSNCTINNNTVTNNYFGILTNTVKTKNNVIMNNNITRNQMIGLGTCNSDNYVIYQNTITYNGYGGIELLDSKNNIVHTNLIMSNDGPGIFISNLNNTIIQNNLIPGNIYGLYMEYCGNCTVYGNLIAQGIVGMYVNSSIVDINFNRIASNSQYELISENGNVNATNNWWGSNSNPVNLGEIVYSGDLDYNPWLILSIDPSSTVNSGGNASITADLTHNNLGEDTSSLGHVIKGLPITFGTNYGTILTPALTFNGKAVAILNLGTTAPRTVTVNASLDSQTVSLQMVIAPGSAVLNITSSALNSTTLQPISLTYNVPLNSSVAWVSVLWKNTQYLFYGELQVIVNGTVVKSIGYVNPGYNTWKNSGYRVDVFRAIIYANNYILQVGINPNAVPASFWNDLTSLYSLTSTELQFIQNHRLEFIDNLTVQLSYPGADAPAMIVTDPVTNSTIDLNFTGGTVLRTSPIMYMDGFGVGYEGVKSFAIANTKVNDDILTYWLNQNSTYPVGAMKAAYGTFLTALLVEYCHDQVADVVASECNVTWSRTHPIAVSVGDDAYQTYLTLECDHSMGMTVAGSLKNMILFNYICSSVISPIEYGVMNNLGLTQISATNSSVNSVVMDLFKDINNNTNLLMFIQNGYMIIKSEGNNSNFLVFDSETGIVRDINTVYNYYGAYCFHDQLTSQSYEQGENFQEKEEYININSMIRLGVGYWKIFTGCQLIGRGIVALPAFPVGTAVGTLAIGVGGLIVVNGAWQVKNSVYDGWTTDRSYEEQLNQDWHEWIHTLLL